MQSFIEYLNEENTDAIASRLQSYKQWGEMYISGRRKEAYISALDTFIKAVHDGLIYSSDYGDNYAYGIGRGIEEISKSLDDKYAHIERGNGRVYELFKNSTLFGLQSLKSYVKDAQTYADKFPLIADFANGIKTMKDDIDYVKSLLVKGRKPAPIDPNTFRKPVAEYDVQKKVIKFLDDAVASFKEEYTQVTTQYYEKLYSKIKTITSLEELKKLSGNEAMIASAIFISKKLFNSTTQKYINTIELKSNSDEIIQRIIRDDIGGVINEFLSKNTSKLALIFSKKELVSEHKILYTKIHQNSLNNSMYFKFNDGSNFVINSDIVYSISALGKPFIKLVTRFTNVTKSDGTKISMPSEEKMIKEF